MRIEERVADAILDLQGLLAEGIDVESAIADVANSYQLKESVVRERAIKALGTLEKVKPRVEREVASAQERQESKAAISEYANLETDEPAAVWLAKRLNRTPSYEELRDALSLSMEAFLKRHLHEFRR